MIEERYKAEGYDTMYEGGFQNKVVSCGLLKRFIYWSITSLSGDGHVLKYQNIRILVSK